MDAGEPSKAAAGSSPRGATAIRPRSRSPLGRGHPVGEPGQGVGVRAGAASAPGGSRLTWSRTSSGPPRSCAPGQRRDQLAPGRRTHHVGVRRDGGRLVALQGADEVPRRSRSATRRPSPRPPGGGSPHVGDPEVGEHPHVGGGEELGDHDQAHVVRRRGRLGAGARDPAAYRRRGWPRARRRGQRSRQPHQAGEAAGGGTVAAVGVEVRRLARAPGHVDDLTPASLELGRTPAPRSRAGCPRGGGDAGRHDRADLAAQLLGHLVAGPHTCGPTQAASSLGPGSRIRWTARAATPAARPGPPGCTAPIHACLRRPRAAPGRSPRPAPSAAHRVGPVTSASHLPAWATGL